MNGLNSGYETLPKEQKIRYMRTNHELQADYANILKTVNRLMGVADWSKDDLDEIFSKVKTISGMEVTHAIKSKPGSKVTLVEFKTGKNIFTLKSWSRFHCIFKRIPDISNELTLKISNILQKKAKHPQKDEVKHFQYLSAAEYLEEYQKPQEADPEESF